MRLTVCVLAGLILSVSAAGALADAESDARAAFQDAE